MSEPKSQIPTRAHGPAGENGDSNSPERAAHGTVAPGAGSDSSGLVEEGLLVLSSASEQDTFLMGSLLGKLVGPGTLIGLTGPLGAGKTRFVQGLARGMGVDSRVRIHSPTYTYVNEHHASTMPLYHMDLYRLGSLDELEEIGYRDFYFGDGVCAVEWFDLVPEAIPGEYLEVIIGVLPQGREFTFRAVGGHSARAFAPLKRGWYAHKLGVEEA